MDVSKANEHPEELVLLQHPRPINVHGRRGEDIEAIFYLYDLIHQDPTPTPRPEQSVGIKNILSDKDYKIIALAFEDSR